MNKIEIREKEGLIQHRHDGGAWHWAKAGHRYEPQPVELGKYDDGYDEGDGSAFLPIIYHPN